MYYEPRPPDDDPEQMLRYLIAILAAAVVLPASAQAAGGDYVFQGASRTERSTVRAALNASSFDWNVVPKQVTVHVGRYGVSHATPGHVWLDRGLLASGRFSWATVMDEYAHQVDFFVLDPARRARASSSGSAPAPGATRSQASHTTHTAANGSPR